MTDRISSLVVELERCIYRLQLKSLKTCVDKSDLLELDRILMQLRGEIANLTRGSV